VYFWNKNFKNEIKYGLFVKHIKKYMCKNSDLKKLISKTYARSKSVEKYKKIDTLHFDFLENSKKILKILKKEKI